MLLKILADKRRIGIWGCLLFLMVGSLNAGELPTNLRVVLDSTQPVSHSRMGRLPLFVLPISGSLQGIPDSETRDALQHLDARAIGYSVEWRHAEFEESLREGLRLSLIHI